MNNFELFKESAERNAEKWNNPTLKSYYILLTLSLIKSFGNHDELSEELFNEFSNQAMQNTIRLSKELEDTIFRIYNLNYVDDKHTIVNLKNDSGDLVNLIVVKNDDITKTNTIGVTIEEVEDLGLELMKDVHCSVDSTMICDIKLGNCIAVEFRKNQVDRPIAVFSVNEYPILNKSIENLKTSNIEEEDSNQTKKNLN